MSSFTVAGGPDSEWMLTSGVMNATGLPFTLHDGAVTATTPARTNSLPPHGGSVSAWQRGRRCTSMGA
jgi:hypothetical protein